MVTYDFTDKGVLITGGSRGVGRATAIAFAQAGARVVFTFERNETAARETLAMLGTDRHHAVQVDGAQAEAIRTVTQEADLVLGGIDILVNNAGIFHPHPIDGSMPFDEWLATWQKTINVNLTGAAVAAFTAAESMRTRGGGKIINVGSRGAFRGEAGQPGYGASKAGLHAFGQSLAQALGHQGITVHNLAPGFIETAMARPWLQGDAGDAVRAQSPLNRVATVSEVAQAILFLASAPAEFTTGCILDLNGASYLRT